jgi:hypothetical protein
MGEEMRPTWDDLKAMEAREQAATPGPWAECVFAEDYATTLDERGVHCPEADETYQKADGTWHTLHICRGMAGPNREANSRFIAAARQDVPVLLAEVWRLRKLVEDGLEYMQHDLSCDYRVINRAPPSACNCGLPAWQEAVRELLHEGPQDE